MSMLKEAGLTPGHRLHLAKWGQMMSVLLELVCILRSSLAEYWSLRVLESAPGADDSGEEAGRGGEESPGPAQHAPCSRILVPSWEWSERERIGCIVFCMSLKLSVKGSDYLALRRRVVLETQELGL